MLFVQAVFLSNVGRVRRNNEDNVFFAGEILTKMHENVHRPDPMKFFLFSQPWFAVFDGMGGEACGEIASHTAARCTKQLKEIKSKSQGNMCDFLNSVCQEINAAVFRKSEELCINRMGSTLAMLCLHGQNAYICNLGDSRIFRIRGHSLEQLSEDHTDAEELRKRGIQRKARLTQYLGINPEEVILEPHIESVRLKRKDTFLLCSDGLTDMLTNEEISSILCDRKNISDCAEKLVKCALEKGGKDNITVIVCRIR